MDSQDLDLVLSDTTGSGTHTDAHTHVVCIYFIDIILNYTALLILK